MGIAEFVYSVILKPRPLRAIANTVIRGVLPTSVRYGDVAIALNPKDPVISGALALRVYEKAEMAFLRRTFKPGSVVLDVGANVGLYTAMAGVAVGPSGRVIALEPDPESYAHLQKTIALNSLSNVQAINAAASLTNGVNTLFTSSNNRGDNRLYNNELCDGSVEVQTVCLDDYLPTLGVHSLDVIKMDVQGYEGHVIAGLEKTILRSGQIVVLMEFWPDGLSRAGTDPKQLLDQLESFGLSLQELSNGGDTRPISDKLDLIRSFPGRKYTNIVAART